MNMLACGFWGGSEYATPKYTTLIYGFFWAWRQLKKYTWAHRCMHAHTHTHMHVHTHTRYPLSSPRKGRMILINPQRQFYIFTTQRWHHKNLHNKSNRAFVFHLFAQYNYLPTVYSFWKPNICFLCLFSSIQMHCFLVNKLYKPKF